MAKELDRQLNLNEAVLRTKVIRPEPTESPTDDRHGRISMAGETIITVIGNLTDDPELRFTPSGAAVANFTVASTPRTFDRQTNEWKDGETLFLRCSVWRQAAENVAESLHPGHPRHRHRPAQAAVVRDQGGREAHRRRARGRRGRPVAALRHARSPRPSAAVAVAAARRRRRPVAAVAVPAAAPAAVAAATAAPGPTDPWATGAVRRRQRLPARPPF